MLLVAIHVFLLNYISKKKLSVHDFHSAMCLFNEAVRRHPPPGHKAIWIAALLTLWVMVSCTIYILWNFLLLKENPYILLTVPSIMLLTAILWIWRYRYLHSIVRKQRALFFTSSKKITIRSKVPAQSCRTMQPNQCQREHSRSQLPPHETWTGRPARTSCQNCK